jgi:hypothetical protein
MDRPHDMLAIHTQRSSGIAERRNLLRRALIHGWFSMTSVGELTGDLRSEENNRFTRWRK